MYRTTVKLILRKLFDLNYLRKMCGTLAWTPRFSDFFSTSCGPSFSGHGYPTQCAANTCRPRSDHFWLRELRVSRHFSTFYGPSVQSMDTQLGALPTLPAPARTVSPCS